jgi:uncharacterized protein (DUF2235 family)
MSDLEVAVDTGPIPGQDSASTTTSPAGQAVRRNLVLCLDGTSNKFCEKNTNVVKLFALLQTDKDQLVYYDSGIGSSPSIKERQRGSLFERAEQVADMALAL